MIKTRARTNHRDPQITGNVPQTGPVPGSSPRSSLDPGPRTFSEKYLPYVMATCPALLDDSEGKLEFSQYS